MILVTGTKRSGTSLWMQILRAAGFPVIGDPFPARWGESIRDANLRGFYESRLRSGIFFATNPDPKTGQFVSPASSRRHVVKVFVPGLVRTDVAYLDRVVATVRHWSEYGPSLDRLHGMEDTYFSAQPDAERVMESVRRQRSTLPPEIEWFFENYEIVRDVSARKYPINVSTYDQLLADPEAVIDKVLPWLGGGDRDAACAAVDEELRSRRIRRDALEYPYAEDFEAFYEALGSASMSKSLIQRLNALRVTLEGVYGALSRDRGREDDPPGSVPGDAG
jgi:hypothetical protein